MFMATLLLLWLHCRVTTYVYMHIKGTCCSCEVACNSTRLPGRTRYGIIMLVMASQCWYQWGGQTTISKQQRERERERERDWEIEIIHSPCSCLIFSYPVQWFGLWILSVPSPSPWQWPVVSTPSCRYSAEGGSTSGLGAQTSRWRCHRLSNAWSDIQCTRMPKLIHVTSELAWWHTIHVHYFLSRLTGKPKRYLRWSLDHIQ